VVRIHGEKITMMKEQFLCTATGVKDKKPYSTLLRIVQGTKNDNSGDTYCFADQKNKKYESEEIPIGTIVTYESKRVQVPASPPPAPKSTKA